jgi:ribonucleotide monophosphatase NagD (HAD superfamily)
VGAVIVGFDRNINYHKIQTAQLCINENPGCQFIATNLDAVRLSISLSVSSTYFHAS